MMLASDQVCHGTWVQQSRHKPTLVWSHSQILPQILGSLPRKFWRVATDHHHSNLDITQIGAAHLRHAALLARRRARPARRRRELVAQLRRRSRDVLELPDPGPVLRSSLEHGGGGGTEECRRAAGLVGRSKRAVGQSAEPRRRARWSAYDSPIMPSH